MSLVNVGGFLLLFSSGAYLLFGLGGMSRVPDEVFSLRKIRDRPEKTIEVAQQRFRFDGNPAIKVLLFVLSGAMGAAGLTVLALSLLDSQSNTWILGVLFMIAGVKLCMLVQTFYKVQFAVDKDGLTMQSLFKKLDVPWKNLIFLDKKTMSNNNEMRCIYTLYNAITYCGDGESISKFDVILEQALNIGSAPNQSSVEVPSSLVEQQIALEQSNSLSSSSIIEEPKREQEGQNQ